MANVADFVTFTQPGQKVAVTSALGQFERVLEETLPDIPVYGEGAVLTWNHWQIGGTASYQLLLNGKLLDRYHIEETDTFPRSLQKNIATGDIRFGSNELKLKWSSGQTSWISDVTLWFRQNTNSFLD